MAELPLESAILINLREEKRWPQIRLAKAIDRSSSLICQYEKGNKSLDRDRLEQLAAAMDYAPVAVEVTRLLLMLLRELLARCEGQADEDCQIALAGAQAALAAGRATLPALDQALAEAKVRREGEEAEELVRELLAFPAEERSFLVGEAAEYQTAAVCVRLCDESVNAAAHSAADAMKIAELALRVSRLVPAEEGGNGRLEGYCQGHVGNAFRVEGDHEGAEVAFVLAWKLWKAGTEPKSVCLDEARLLDLEASLCRDQRRFEKSLALLEEVRAKARSQEQVIRGLLKKATTLEQMGEYERAGEVLAEAEPHVDGQRQRRQLWVLRINQTVNYLHLERYDEAEFILPEVRALAIELRNGLDLLRTLWLTGRAHAGRGRLQEAAAALEQVRGEFTARGMAYDVALVTLELAAVRLEQANTSEVKRLAREAREVFRSKKIHREAQAALETFRTAAERETVTLEKARALVRYLYRARYDPALRFIG